MGKAGITSVGVYIPYYCVSRATLGGGWDARGTKGNRSMINFDEDSVTLAFEAAENCFKLVDRKRTDALFFASTTAPYAEKSHSALVSTALDLGNVFAADFAQCTKAAASALRLALDSCNAGSFRQIAVTAADCRDAYPKTTQEQMFGDAAAALTVGTENVLATVDGFAGTSNEITDIWRNSGDKYVSFAEARFVTNHGYMTEMPKAVSAAAEKAGVTLDQIQKFVFTSANAKDCLTLAKRLKIAPEKVQDPLMQEIGYCGTAQPLLLLAVALLDAQPGDKILMAAYGNGADAFVFTATEEIRRLDRDLFDKYLRTRGEIRSYGQFLSFRGLLQADPGQPYNIKSSTAAEWRLQDTYIRCYASRCKTCGMTMFPANRVCEGCHSLDDYKTFRAPDHKVKVFTYTLDNYAGRSDFPLLGHIIAEDEFGTRYYMNSTDFKREDIQVGAEMEFTFRKIHNLAGFVNYYWKVRPVRRMQGGNDNG